MTRLRVIGAGLAISGLALVGGVTSASAVPPLPLSGEVFDNTPVADCGTFEVWDDLHLSSNGHLFFDKDGNPVRVVELVTSTDRLYNPENGKSLTGVAKASEVVDLVDGQATENGQTFRILFPGVGVVLLNVGCFTIDFEEGLIFLAGRQEFFEGDLDALCAALS